MNVRTLLPALLLLSPAVSGATGLELPSEWTHTYQGVLDTTLVLTISYRAPLDSCVIKDDDDQCLRLVEDLVAADWSHGADDFTTYFSLGDGPGDDTVYLEGWDRSDTGGFYSTPVPWVPASADHQAGHTWSWSGDLIAAGSAPLPASLMGSVDAVDAILMPPIRPLGVTTLQLTYDSSVGPETSSSPVDILGFPRALRKAVNTRWWGDLQLTVCVMFADDDWDLVAVEDPLGQSVRTAPVSFGAFKARH